MTGDELKGARQKLGLSVDRAARMVETTARTWRRWEDESRDIAPGVVKLVRLALDLRAVRIWLGIDTGGIDGTTEANG